MTSMIAEVDPGKPHERTESEGRTGCCPVTLDETESHAPAPIFAPLGDLLRTERIFSGFGDHPIRAGDHEDGGGYQDERELNSADGILSGKVVAT